MLYANVSDARIPQGQEESPDNENNLTAQWASYD